jgi:hypothetical protein
VGDHGTAQVGLQATNQQENTVIKALLDPLVMTLHVVASLAFIFRKLEQNNKHQ